MGVSEKLRTEGNRTVGGIGSRALNRLTDLRIKAFIKAHNAGKASSKKLSDGGGMYLTVTPAGTPVWRSKYRFAGKERLYAIGTYPQVTLEGARAARESIKAHLREGRDPLQARKLDGASSISASANTFRIVAEDWFSKRKEGWSGIHYEKSWRAFERDVFPKIGVFPVSKIGAPMVAEIMEAILKRGARETAAKVLQHCSGVFRLAQAKGLCSENPAEPVREVLPRKTSSTHRPAIVEWRGLGEILRGAEAAHLSPAVRMAHRLCAFTVARISNIVEAEWIEFDLESEVPTWVIPRSKMKARDRHHNHKIVLAQPVAEELKRWRSLGNGKGYLFPSPAGTKHISRESLEKAYRVTLGLGDKHSPHGWRAAFSTLARDNGFDREVVELMLDHVHDNDVARAYDRGERLEKRIQLARWWCDELIRAQRGADVLPIGRGQKAK